MPDIEAIWNGTLLKRVGPFLGKKRINIKNTHNKIPKRIPELLTIDAGTRQKKIGYKNFYEYDLLILCQCHRGALKVTVASGSIVLLYYCSSVVL